MFLRKLRATVSDEPTGFVWVEEGRLAASGYPASRGQLEWLKERGVGVILTLTERPIPAEVTTGLGIDFVNVPMKDHEPPNSDSLTRAADAIAAGLKSGKVVLVHCLAGEGRTGCALAAFMIRERRMEVRGALDAIRKAKPAFVERAQESAVEAFAAARV